MQVFIPYDKPIAVAQCLDRRRLWKQILECHQIIKAIDGAQGWKNHPVVNMYKRHRSWLLIYLWTLSEYRRGNTAKAQLLSDIAQSFKPPFVGKFLCNHHKRRLYTKSPELYPQFAHYGISYQNWYVVKDQLLIF